MDLNVLQTVTPALSGLIGAVIGSASSIAASYIQTKRAHKNSELELLNARKREIYDRSISLVADLKLDSDKLFDDLYRASLASLGGSVRVYCDSSFAGCFVEFGQMVFDVYGCYRAKCAELDDEWHIMRPIYSDDGMLTDYQEELRGDYRDYELACRKLKAESKIPVSDIHEYLEKLAEQARADIWSFGENKHVGK